MTLIALAAGCQVTPSTVSPAARSPKPVVKASPTATPGSTPTPGGLTGSGEPPRIPLPSAATATPSPGPLAVQKPYFGRVLDLKGMPIAGVEVRGFILSNNSGGLISNNGGGVVSLGGGNVVSTGGGSVVSTGGGSVVSTGGASYSLRQAVNLSTRTAEDGTFRLVSADGRPINLEAVAADDIKAFAPAVSSETLGLDMRLAYTGTLAGRVTTRDPLITDLTGIDVFVPGTSYVAKTDAKGAFTIANVPVGTFDLVASKASLGTATATGLAVRSKEVAQATLELAVSRPAITALTPPDGGKGLEITIKGKNFGASKGLPFQLVVGGATVASPVRKDDETITFKVPDGIVSYDVIVTVDGLVSAPGRFTEVREVYASATRFIRPNRTFPFNVVAFDQKGNPFVSESLEIGFAGDAIALKDGKLVSKGEGRSTLTLRSGDLVSMRELTVTAAPYVETLVGNGVAGAVNGVGTQAQLNHPFAVLPLESGAYVVADVFNHVLRGVVYKAELQQGANCTLYAGTGTVGSSDGPANTAQFNGPAGLAARRGPDKLAKGIFIAELGGHRIRYYDGTTTSTLAGTGVAGFEDGDGATAKFNQPIALAFDGVRTLYVADRGNNRIRAIDVDDPKHPVTTIAGTGVAGHAEGEGATALLNGPQGLVLDAAGDLYVSDASNNRIRKIALRAPGRPVSTFAGAGVAGYLDGPAPTAQFQGPSGLVFDGAGNLYVGEIGNGTVRMITPAGVVSTFAGIGRPGISDDLWDRAAFAAPGGLAIDEELGYLLVADEGANAVRMIYYK